MFYLTGHVSGTTSVILGWNNELNIGFLHEISTISSRIKTLSTVHLRNVLNKNSLDFSS